MSRKRICLLTIFPEGEYQKCVLPGIFSQCEKYGYDVVVVSPLVQICSYNKEFLEGELTIFDLVNFDLFDGVIITPIPMTENQIYSLTEKLLTKIKQECKVPVVSLDMPFGDYHTVYTDDESAFYSITDHLIKVHNCKDIAVLGGYDAVPLCKARMSGIQQAMDENGLSIDPEKIYKGDFWYTSGEMLGNRYVIGELKLPDAVICLSDHMAIGLTNYLIKHGIKVPEQVIVTGYEAVVEASMNTPPITSYSADHTRTGALAVNYLHGILDPEEKEIEFPLAGKQNLCIGGTCGCHEDFRYTRERLLSGQINCQYDYSDTSPDRKVTMGMLLESYMTERLTSTSSPYECFGEIYQTKYLIKPFERFYICMNDNWLKPSFSRRGTYTKNMQLAMIAERNSALHGVKNHVFVAPNVVTKFKTSHMLPSLHEGYDVPQVYYFVPIHFGSISLGYAVLQNNLSAPGAIDTVFRNYIRNIDNAIEMIRAKYQIAYLSEHDIMTDLYNRRGMENRIYEMKVKASANDRWFAIVIDMDDLKIRNDKYGHSEGDKGIVTVAEAAFSITDKKEICVRGGGDEFFIIGLGDYDDVKLREKLDRFEYYLEGKNEMMDIPVSASIGYALQHDKRESYQEVLEYADMNMYRSKQQKKKERMN